MNAQHHNNSPASSHELTQKLEKQTRMAISIKVNSVIWHIGSDALPGKMLDLGLLKISWNGFFLFLAPAGPYHNPFSIYVQS